MAQRMTGKDRWQQLASVRRARLSYWLDRVGSRTRVEQVEPGLAEQRDYQQLAERWNDLAPEQEAQAGVQLEEIFRRVAYATRPYCQRCGVCCDGAGPTLYPGDERLVREGIVARSQLVTLRAGETVFSRWHGRPIALEQECVRIVAAGSQGCRLFDPARQSCAIYDDRPSQCRTQRCWDTSAADRLLATAGLTRWQLLDESFGARELLAEHEGSCSVSGLRDLWAFAGAGDDDAQAGLDQLLADDHRIRSRLVDSGAATPDELPFLLGCPCDELVERLADEPD